MKQLSERAFLFTPPPPLQDIETIPWRQIQGTYGSAEQAPLLLQQLLSPDSEEQRHALDELDKVLMHTYASEAAIYAVPFLLRSK